ncbi:MAG: SDR family oxidoreductase [archaeon]|jgi:NADP-dependent 3-hydroxy acid dehydrogenase YdfG
MAKKIIVISGGSDGLGKEIASILSKNNKVIILSPTLKKLQKVSKKINCNYAVCDVSSFEQCKNTINKIIKKYKRIDYLINNAGLWIEGELESNSPERIQKVIEVNLNGLIYLTKSVIPIMKKQKKGTIININSQGGMYSKKAKRSVYCATKWGVNGLTQSLQPELAIYGIRVMGIYPGRLNTKMFEKMGIKKDLKNSLEPSEIAKLIEFITTLKETTNIPELGIKYITN